MTYSGNELAALVKLGLAMAEADGHVDQVEHVAIASELRNFGVNESSVSVIIAKAAIMDAAEAIATLAVMTT